MGSRNDDWVDTNVIKSIDQTFSKTFAAPAKGSISDFIRLLNPHQGREDGLPPPYLDEEIVRTTDALKLLTKAPDICQIVCMRQKHSYARLDITKDFFEQLLEQYKVFPRIWDFVLPFSFKTSESDIGHAPFRFHIRSQNNGQKPVSFECAYGLRYVELNGRQPAERSDHDPWSIRQTAIYQQYDCEMDRIVFILISPSDVVKEAFTKALAEAGSKQRKLHSFELHLILVSLLHSNWRLYVRSLEKIMREQSDRVTLAQVEREDSKLSPLLNFAVNFVDRQRLKMMEDKVLDLMIIFESVHNTLSMLQKQCKKHCLGPDCKDCNCEMTIEELQEQMHEAQVNLKKAEILHKRAQATAHLLSDLLDYENALIAHSNEKALNGLVKETKDENSKMRVLSERSTKDATAVKLLTVITLIYLPMTVVANVFSSQIVQVDNATGRISVASGAWWFAAISVPLTIVTFLLWWWWLKHAERVGERNQAKEVENQAEKTTKGPEQGKMNRVSDWAALSISNGVSKFRSRKHLNTVLPS